MNEKMSLIVLDGINIKQHHWHTDIEFLLVLEGDLILCVGKKKGLLKKRQLAVVSSGVMHFTCGISENSRVVSIRINPSIYTEDIEGSYSVKFDDPFITDSFMCDKIFCFYYNFDAERNHSGIFLKALVYNILCELKDIPYSLVSGTSYKYAKEIQRLIDEINETPQEEMNLPLAAQHVHLSPNYFSSLFKEITGLTFIKYLQIVRIEKAMELIRGGKASIVEIAYACGFESLRTFNRVFREVSGTTPTDYLKKSVSTGEPHNDFRSASSPEPEARHHLP